MRSLIMIRDVDGVGVLLFWMSFFLPSFLFCFLQLAYKSHRRMNRYRSTLSRRVLRQGCAFWELELEYIIFAFSHFSPKMVKIKRK